MEYCYASMTPSRKPQQDPQSEQTTEARSLIEAAHQYRKDILFICNTETRTFRKQLLRQLSCRDIRLDNQ